MDGWIDTGGYMGGGIEGWVEGWIGRKIAI
jgi:hypothetical protein